MARIRCARLLSLSVIAALPLGALAPACSSGTGTAGQRISCTDRGAGPVDCHPMTGTASDPGSGANETCEDIDEDGDGTPHDEGDDAADVRAAVARGHDGAEDSADDDDDDDGIENERDCDSRDDEDEGEDDGADDHGDDDGDDPDGPDGPDDDDATGGSTTG